MALALPVLRVRGVLRTHHHINHGLAAQSIIRQVHFFEREAFIFVDCLNYVKLTQDLNMNLKALKSKLHLFVQKHAIVEQLLQALVGEVYAELLEGVFLEVLEASDVEDPDESLSVSTPCCQLRNEQRSEKIILREIIG
jgi:hypothetical protein